jgi:hypothetical protein
VTDDGTPVVEERAPASVSTPPLLTVVNPDATAEEVAALVAVFAALGTAPPDPPLRRTPEWQANRRRLRVTHPHGPGGWRASGLPR